jgi:(2Fe-2S) ferredoxin
MGKKDPAHKAKKLQLGKLRAHVLVCTGGKCATKPEQKRAVANLRKRLKARGLTERDGGVMCTGVGCLQVCAGGPVAVVWPDGVWYRNATPENLDRILEEHIIGGKVIKKLRIAGPAKTRGS